MGDTSPRVLRWAWRGRRDQPRHPRIGVSARRDQHHLYTETGTIRTPGGGIPGPSIPFPSPRKVGVFHLTAAPVPQCLGGHVTTSHLPSVAWAWPAIPGLQRNQHQPQTSPRDGFAVQRWDFGTARPGWEQPRQQPPHHRHPLQPPLEPVHTRESGAGGRVTPSPASPHRAMCLLPFVHIT